jgi:hypothetical protein
VNLLAGAHRKAESAAKKHAATTQGSAKAMKEAVAATLKAPGAFENFGKAMQTTAKMTGNEANAIGKALNSLQTKMNNAGVKMTAQFTANMKRAIQKGNVDKIYQMIEQAFKQMPERGQVLEVPVDVKPVLEVGGPAGAFPMNARDKGFRAPGVSGKLPAITQPVTRRVTKERLPKPRPTSQDVDRVLGTTDPAILEPPDPVTQYVDREMRGHSGTSTGSGWGSLGSWPWEHDGGRMHVGGMFLHHGGQALGPDEVPAILQRGEWVIRKSQSQKYDGLLNSINSGQIDEYMHHGGVAGGRGGKGGRGGGHTVNINLSGFVGDPGKAAGIIGNEMMKQLERERAN